jgi:hypothetical protein
MSVLRQKADEGMMENGYAQMAEAGQKQPFEVIFTAGELTHLTLLLG